MLPQRKFINQILKLPFIYWLLFSIITVDIVTTMLPDKNSFQILGCYLLLYFSVIYIASTCTNEAEAA